VRLFDSVVIGAGQAGLSASYHLHRRGVDHVVFDANAVVGGGVRQCSSWASSHRSRTRSGSPGANLAGVIQWATGFRPEVGHLAPLHLRGPRGGIQLDGTTVVADPRVQLVGYGPSASTIGANRAGRAAAAAVGQQIRRAA